MHYDIYAVLNVGRKIWNRILTEYQELDCLQELKTETKSWYPIRFKAIFKACNLLFKRSFLKNKFLIFYIDEG